MMTATSGSFVPPIAGTVVHEIFGMGAEPGSPYELIAGAEPGHEFGETGHQRDDAFHRSSLQGG